VAGGQPRVTEIAFSVIPLRFARYHRPKRFLSSAR
jgi:hypothetical protein